MQFSTADLRGFHALPLKKRREFLALCAMLESHDERDSTKAERERLGSEDEKLTPEQALQRVRDNAGDSKAKTSGKNPRRRKGIKVKDLFPDDDNVTELFPDGIPSDPSQQALQPGTSKEHDQARSVPRLPN